MVFPLDLVSLLLVSPDASLVSWAALGTSVAVVPFAVSISGAPTVATVSALASLLLLAS